MTQEEAQHKFWESFGIPAYAQTAVPESPVLPYLVYQSVSGYWGDTASPTVQLWYYTESEAIPNAKADEIAAAIGLGGVVIKCDCGAIWVGRGDPWRVAANAQDEKNMKVRQLNVRMQFLISQ